MSNSPNATTTSTTPETPDRTFVPKLVAIDLDGTVVHHSDTRVRPHPKTVEALARVREAGVPVVIVTGRAPWSALPTVEDLGISDGYVSVSHGAVEYDLDARDFSHRITFDTGPAVSKFLAANDSVEFAAEIDADGYWYTPGLRRNFKSTFAGEIDLEKLSTTPAARLVAQVESTTPYGAGHVCPNAQQLVDTAQLDPATYHVEVGFNGWVDVGPPSVNKASGLARIAARYGVKPEETVAFGDAANDLTMFEWVGHAVAMGQATKQVKAAADEIAPPVGEHGVATVLKRWFP